MANTTNFGWETPDDTDLVKDGALAMRTLGNAIDTSLVDLKGGTTGQVLSKTSNTDMDFTWTSPNPGDITEVTVSSPITGGGSSGSVNIAIQDGTTAQKGAVQLEDSTSSTSTTKAATPNSVKTSYDLANAAIPKSLVDAKADLITATADNTPARLAVGSNGDTLVADSSATTGLRWQSADNANVIINGGMDIWQRGTSSSTPGSSAYLNVDRFYHTGSASAVTYTQKTDVPTSKYFQYSLGMSTTAGNGASFGQRIEAANSVGLAGQTVTLSLYAKGISGSTNLFVNFYYPTAKDNYAGVTQIGSSNELSSNPSGSWTRYSVTVTLPSDVQNGLLVLVGRGTGACETYITGLQLELGSVATTFKRAGGTIQGELAACQRYYWRASATATSNVLSVMGTAYNTSGLIMSWVNPVTMRVKAASIDYSALELADFANAAQAVTSATADANSTTSFSVSVIGVAGTPLTQYRNYAVRSSSASGYVGFSAEL